MGSGGIQHFLLLCWHVRLRHARLRHARLRHARLRHVWTKCGVRQASMTQTGMPTNKNYKMPDIQEGYPTDSTATTQQIVPRVHSPCVGPITPPQFR